MADPFTLLAAIKTGVSAGKTIASLSKEIGQFFDATDQAKKKMSKKRGSSTSSVNSEALDRWAEEQKAAELEEELREWICRTRGISHWHSLLRIRKEVLSEKRELEARLRREAIERQEMALTIAGILVLLTASAIGAAAYLHYMGWIDVRDYFR
tara:strand:+ start:2845 stop:3306 length:462 start_codon:yes stop_codon:yes gene_type:complete